MHTNHNNEKLFYDDFVYSWWGNGEEEVSKKEKRSTILQR